MDFSPPRQRRQSEPALPMINVVFLLLIFFLMSARIVAPPPFELTPPTAEAGSASEADLHLHISAEAALALGDSRDSAVWETLAAVPRPDDTSLTIRADVALPAADLASVLARISGLGFVRVQLATIPR